MLTVFNVDTGSPTWTGIIYCAEWESTFHRVISYAASCAKEHEVLCV